MGYRKVLHKKRIKVTRAQMPSVRAFHYLDEVVDQNFDLLRYFGKQDRVRSCPTDSCNNGQEMCDGSCEHGSN